jgi:hypothetical protein
MAGLKVAMVPLRAPFPFERYQDSHHPPASSSLLICHFYEYIYLIFKLSLNVIFKPYPFSVIDHNHKMRAVHSILFCVLAAFVATLPILGGHTGDQLASLSSVDVLINTHYLAGDSENAPTVNGDTLVSTARIALPGLVACPTVSSHLLVVGPSLVSNARTTATHLLHEGKEFHINKRELYHGEDGLPEAHFNSSSNVQLVDYMVAIAIVLEIVAGTLFVLIVWVFFMKLKQRHAQHQRPQNAEQQRAAAVLNSHPVPVEIELRDLENGIPSAQAAAPEEEQAPPTSPSCPERSQLARCVMRGSGGLGPIFEHEEHDGDDDDDSNPVEPWSPLPQSPVIHSPSPQQVNHYEDHYDTAVLDERTIVADSSDDASSDKSGYEHDHEPYERYHSFVTLT